MAKRTLTKWFQVLWGVVFNTHQNADKIWFELLLWRGVVMAVTRTLFGIGALIGHGVMIAYLRVGPNEISAHPSQITTLAAPPTVLKDT